MLCPSVYVVVVNHLCVICRMEQIHSGGNRLLFRTVSSVLSRGQLKCDGTPAETRFRLSAKRTSPFKSAGASAEVCESAVVMLDTPCSEVV